MKKLLFLVFANQIIKNFYEVDSCEKIFLEIVKKIKTE